MICGTYDTYIITDMKVATQPRVFICLSDIRDSSFIKFFLPCTSRNITNSRFGKTRTYGKTTFTNSSNRNTKNIGSNNIVTKNIRSNFVTRRGAGLHKNRTRNNIVISNKTLQNNRHNQTQLNVVSPNVSKFRSRIFRGQNMTFYRTNNNQLIQLPNEN